VKLSINDDNYNQQKILFDHQLFTIRLKIQWQLNSLYDKYFEMSISMVVNVRIHDRTIITYKSIIIIIIIIIQVKHRFATDSNKE